MRQVLAKHPIHPLGDLFEHHFGRAAADAWTRASRTMRSIAGAAHIAEAAVILLAGIGHLIDQFAAQRLEHGNFAHHVIALVARQAVS